MDPKEPILLGNTQLSTNASTPELQHPPLLRCAVVWLYFSSLSGIVYANRNEDLTVNPVQIPSQTTFCFLTPTVT